MASFVVIHYDRLGSPISGKAQDKMENPQARKETTGKEHVRGLFPQLKAKVATNTLSVCDAAIISDPSFISNPILAVGASN